MRLSSARIAFLRPKARAISRAPTLPGRSPMKARMSAWGGEEGVFCVCLLKIEFPAPKRRDAANVIMQAGPRQLFGGGGDLGPACRFCLCGSHFLRLDRARGRRFTGNPLAAGDAAALWSVAHLSRARFEHPDRLFQRHSVGGPVGRPRGVDARVADVWTIAAVLDRDRSAFVGMLAELLAWIGAEATAAAGISFFLCDQANRAIETDGQHVLAGIEIGVGLAVLHVRPAPSDAA